MCTEFKKILTKSKYIHGLRCNRLLWESVQSPLPKHEQESKRIFIKEYIEKYIHQKYKLNMINLNDFNLNREEKIEKTKKLIKTEKILFGASFEIDNLFAKTDLIVNLNNQWNLYKITTSNTSEKSYYINDLAFQKYILKKTNIEINKSFLIYINKDYKKNNEEKLIITKEVTENVNLINDIEEKTKQYLKIINSKEKPQKNISKRCNKGKVSLDLDKCLLKEKCWDIDNNNIFQLSHYFYWKQYNEKEIKNINDISQEDIQNMSDKNKIIKESIDTGKIHINKEEIKRFLNKLNYPLYHFDFETFQTPIPIFNQSSPHENIAFQYSLHIEQKDGKIVHKEFLSNGGNKIEDDPRPKLLEQMKIDLNKTGSIMIYTSFEKKIIKRLQHNFPQYKIWLNSITERMIDLSIPFGKWYYYNKIQKGSFSLKKVLTAIIREDNYSKLKIQNGEEASTCYLYSHIYQTLKNKQEIRNNLLKYCSLDTKAMVLILRELKKLVM